MEVTRLTIACTGYDIVADWYQGTTTDKILLVLPGYMSSRKRNAWGTQEIVSSTGYSALVIDYSGHGESPFELDSTRPAQHLLEVIFAFDWIKEHYPKALISVIGSSYGGFLAANLTNYRTFAKLILRAPAIYDLHKLYTPWSVRTQDEEAYRQQIIAYRSNPSLLQENPLIAQAASFSGKTYVMVHGQDEIVMPETTDAYISGFNATSYVADLTHSPEFKDLPPEQTKDYYDTIASWLNT